MSSNSVPYTLMGLGQCAQAVRVFGPLCLLPLTSSDQRNGKNLALCGSIGLSAGVLGFEAS